jgi:putative intracellular protease/amidase
MKILMILTSHKEMENTTHKTGLWLGEFTDPYYEFIDRGYDVTLASPKGGEVPIDPLSKLTENITESNRRFQDDEAGKFKLDHTEMLNSVDGNGFDALFIPGGHGPLWDLAGNDICGNLIVDFLTQGKPVGAVCHGPAAFIKVFEIFPDLLRGRRMTAFTNMEETMVLRNNNVPYKLESKLLELGVDFDSAIVPFTPHVETDGIVVTGQNPASAGPAAKALIDLLEAKI